MKGLNSTDWGCRESLPPRCRAADPGIAAPLAPFTTALPPELIERLHGAARELGLHKSLITATAIALVLDGEGF